MHKRPDIAQGKQARATRKIHEKHDRNDMSNPN